ncbi:type II/IV secretion system ATPase subunit [Halomicroarcula sp. F13]|uniref:Type II/IV secretion system ATPase subunit n=2 Tax=Haloarcula rubra TaxID=2487747 RepID=A0AAW4PZ40_9EURY|nr:type II/IV secretion system ATPase subunit [Halomicroarcula rubra]MBX0325364.1 type II/IV secretion system ATPase subunit [Halomicroarcula rubra]
MGYSADVERIVETEQSDDDGGVLGAFGRKTTDDAPVRTRDWAATEFSPATYLGCHPDEFPARVGHAKANANRLYDQYAEWIAATPVTKDAYTWEHFKWEYHYDEDGHPPSDGDGTAEPFDPESFLGFPPEEMEDRLTRASDFAAAVDDIVDRRTVNVNPEIDEDSFFSTHDGLTTLANRYDLEKAVPMEKKRHFVEVERYWVNKPYACVVVFHSIKENEKKYTVVEPYMNDIEARVKEYLTGRLRTAVKYSDEDALIDGSEADRADVIRSETLRLLDQYDLRDGVRDDSVVGQFKDLFDIGEAVERSDRELQGLAARPEPAVIEEDAGTLTEAQVERLLYELQRDFLGYERIDAIKHDVNVEDISCDGYDSPVFVYHTEYENVITNVSHDETGLDNFVVKLAQRSGKGISKRRPQVDATLPDGSRAQLTLGREVSDHGTNYTIRQFKDVPFTPIDLINWNTFSLEEMAFLWLAIENNRSLIFAGGTASGKTTSLNAVSLFIPSNSKIVSIEDTREVELPQRNWVASVTRPSFGEDDVGDVDEFDLLEAALRQRPEFIVMGEVRGEEGRTLFQIMSTGHTTLTTFHADSVGEVLKRFTTDPINVSKTMFTGLDLVSIQTQTRVQGRKVRRNKTITEVNHYDAENDEINIRDIFEWQPESDEFLQLGRSNTLQEIQFDRGWDHDRLQTELFKRKVVLAYLVDSDLNDYAEVAATLQAFINDPEAILALLARGELGESLSDLREMESVEIDIDPEKEAVVPRPDPDPETRQAAREILDTADGTLFEEYRDRDAFSLMDALPEHARAKGAEIRSGLAADGMGTAPLADPVVVEQGDERTDGDTE